MFLSAMFFMWWRVLYVCPQSILHNLNVYGTKYCVYRRFVLLRAKASEASFFSFCKKNLCLYWFTIYSCTHASRWVPIFRTLPNSQSCRVCMRQSGHLSSDHEVSASRNPKVQRSRPSTTQDGHSALWLSPLRARVAELASPISAGSQRVRSCVRSCVTAHF